MTQLISRQSTDRNPSRASLHLPCDAAVGRQHIDIVEWAQEHMRPSKRCGEPRAGIRQITAIEVFMSILRQTHLD